MRRISSNTRIVLGLVSLSVSTLLIAGLLGLIPSVGPAAQKNRSAFCEATAVSFMALAPRMNESQIRRTFDAILERNTEVESIAVRRSETGKLVFSSGPHDELWETRGDKPVTSREFIVPVMSDGKRWGQLEVRFQEINAGPLGNILRPEFSLSIFLGLGLFAAFSFYLKRVLRHLNPSQVIPPRVREALDALAEGLLVIDTEHRIVLANSAFAKHLGRIVDEMIGKNAADLGFRIMDDSRCTDFPWILTLKTGDAAKGVLMKVGTGTGEKTFSINSVPIHDDQQRCRGVVTSFEDVTELDRKQKELRDALHSLRQSSEEIKQQNRELEWLATRDALTGCVNRRSFFKVFESAWQEGEHDVPLSAVMVDIDHFKSINDNHGHAAGDEVLRKVAAIVMKTVSEGDIVCRYGGEEFSVLMPQTGADDAELRAERIRLAIKSLQIGELRVTASLGVSSRAFRADSPQDLLDQADKCLYVAKRNGRNQVIRFDKAQKQIAQLSETLAPTRREKVRHESVTIPFQAVTALVSAMSFRDQSTATHSRRVADLCVATAEGLLSMRECYTLEIAALLHDIGKIGVPDAILHKRERLTDEEFAVMRRHRSVSVQLVRASFGSEILSEIVDQYGVWFDLSNAAEFHGHQKERPSVAARVLAVADAYDSMTTDAAYRKRKSRAEAFEELRRCSGTQFDGEIVERFISAVRLRSGERAEMPGVSTGIALDIGVQIERLMAALDDQDLDELRDLTQRIHKTAEQAGLERMAEVTDQLLGSLEHDRDIIGIMQAANELLDLCRLTQTSLIQGESQRLMRV